MRHQPKDATENSAEVKKKPFRYKKIVVLMSLLLVGYGAFGLHDYYRATNQANPELPQQNTVITEDVVRPSETKIENEDDYDVADNLPRQILFPSTNSSGLVQQVGLNINNAISVPTNVHFAGWFVDSVLPGQKGLSIIDGHVSGRYTDGVFKHLDTLAPGDRFYIEFGDRTQKEFEVVEVVTLPENESAELLLEKKVDIERQLNLITCGGPFDASSNQFTDRVIVISQAV